MNNKLIKIKNSEWIDNPGKGGIRTNTCIECCFCNVQKYCLELRLEITGNADDTSCQYTHTHYEIKNKLKTIIKNLIYNKIHRMKKYDIKEKETSNWMLDDEIREKLLENKMRFPVCLECCFNTSGKSCFSLREVSGIRTDSCGFMYGHYERHQNE